MYTTFFYAERPWTCTRRRNTECESFEITGCRFSPQVNVTFERHYSSDKQDWRSPTKQICDQTIPACRKLRLPLIEEHDLCRKLILTLPKAAPRYCLVHEMCRKSRAQSIKTNSRSGNINSLERETFCSFYSEVGVVFVVDSKTILQKIQRTRQGLVICMKCKFSKPLKTKGEDINRPKEGNIRRWRFRLLPPNQWRR